MSFTPTQIRKALHDACITGYRQQYDLLQSAQLVSAPTSLENLQLILHCNAVSVLDPLPVLSEDQIAELTDMETTIEGISSIDDLRRARTELIDWYTAHHSEDLSEEAIRDRPATDDGLNKRMRDELFLTRGHIRSARRRLNQSGQNYDQQAYISTRNQLLFVHNTYNEQLRLDLVKTTHEQVAKVEDILHPAIVNATGDTFVAALGNLRDFILEQVITPPVA
ncbi:MAG: hypothetical protein AAF741_00560 [Bacteroidota bacterium]